MADPVTDPQAEHVTAHIPGGADMHLVISDDQSVTAAKSTCLTVVC
jgi:hypothetical protein